MLLDVILKEPDLVWLTTSEEKMTHVSAFTAITKDSLPQMTTPRGSYEPVRYFPDQAPIDFALFDHAVATHTHRLRDSQHPGAARADTAADLLSAMTHADVLGDFLTLPAYDQLA